MEGLKNEKLFDMAVTAGGRIVWKYSLNEGHAAFQSGEWQKFEHIIKIPPISSSVLQRNSGVFHYTQQGLKMGIWSGETFPIVWHNMC